MSEVIKIVVAFTMKSTTLEGTQIIKQIEFPCDADVFKTIALKEFLRNADAEMEKDLDSFYKGGGK